MAKGDYNDAANFLGQIGNDLSEALKSSELAELGAFAERLISERTKAGIDVDGKPFAPYSKAYAKFKASKGRSTRVDLAFTGHMFQALGIHTDATSVTLLFRGRNDAQKASVHNFGFNGAVLVKAHSRGTAVDKQGRRVSKREINLDKRRKYKRVYQRREAVVKHSRMMKMPQREFMDVRMDSELEALAEVVGRPILGRIERTVNR